MANKQTGIIIDASTGEIVERELSAEEIQDISVLAVREAELKLAEQAKSEARNSALAKLSALGLTEEEIAAL